MKKKDFSFLNNENIKDWFYRLRSNIYYASTWHLVKWNIKINQLKILAKISLLILQNSASVSSAVGIDPNSSRQCCHVLKAWRRVLWLLLTLTLQVVANLPAPQGVEPTTCIAFHHCSKLLFSVALRLMQATASSFFILLYLFCLGAMVYLGTVSNLV